MLVNSVEIGTMWKKISFKKNEHTQSRHRLRARQQKVKELSILTDRVINNLFMLKISLLRDKDMFGEAEKK